MVDVSSQNSNISINVSSSSNSASINTSTSSNSASINATPDMAMYYSEKSREWAISNRIVDGVDYSSKYYAQQSNVNAQKAVQSENNVKEIYNSLLEQSDSISNEIREVGNETISSIEATKTTILNDIEFVADGEKQEIQSLVDDGKDEIKDLANLIKENAQDIASRTSFAMFDTVLKDYILTYEESKGLALQGTYVYKEAVAGSRYGYAGFYNKCLEEFENSEYEKIAFEQPVLSANGTLGSDSFAVSASMEQNSGSNIYYAYRCFASNANTSETTSWQALATTASYTIYNPKALNITNIQITNRSSYPRAIASGTVLGSNDNDTWEEITSFTNTNNNTSVVWNIDLSNNKKSYKYYKLDNLKGIDGEWIGIGKINITATYASIYKTNPNGHIFYDISEKDKIDELFSSTGIAWFYGIDQENERVFLPRNIKYFDQPTDDTSAVGELIEAGLPNITGVLGIGNGNVSANKPSGAFYDTGASSSGPYNGYGSHNSKFAINASRSSKVYGNSDTVQPNAVKKLLYICVGTTEVQNVITDVIEVTTTENDTLPLLHHIPADELLEHPSWLRSNGQWNDGNAYKTAYNYLVNEYIYGTDHTDTLKASDGTEYTVAYRTVKGKKVVDMANVAQVDAVYSAMGSAWYYVINQDDMTFRLPISHNSECYTSDPTRVGLDVSAGLPNIKGVFTSPQQLNAGFYMVTASGAFSNLGGNGYNDSIRGTTTTSTQAVQCGFDASLYNPIYGNSDTVTPPHTEFYLYFKVANAVQNLELLDAGEVLEAVNKIGSQVENTLNDKLALLQTSYVVETYKSGDSWYRVYSDGWCEQGGVINSSSSGSTNTVSLLKPFKDKTYNVFWNNIGNIGGAHEEFNTQKISASQFSIRLYGYIYSITSIMWQAKGYIK